MLKKAKKTSSALHFQRTAHIFADEKTRKTMCRQLEFYQYDGELRCKEGRKDFPIEESNEDIIDLVLNIVQSYYPTAYEALRDEYRKSRANRSFHRYRMAHRFLCCNFSVLDSTHFDIDGNKMNFENVECPIRAECRNRGLICHPKFCSHLTEHETNIARMWFSGQSKLEIANELYLSTETINTHIRNIYSKLGVHDKASFVRYAYDNRMFS